MRYVVMQAVQTLEKQGFDPEVRTQTDALTAETQYQKGVWL